MKNTRDLTLEGRVQSKMLRFEFLSNEGCPDHLSTETAGHQGGTTLPVWKPIFQKGLKGHDVRSCDIDEV